MGIAAGETLLPGQPVDFAVIYAPTSVGAAGAILTLGGNPAFTFALSGTATTQVPEPPVWPVLAAALALLRVARWAI